MKMNRLQCAIILTLTCLLPGGAQKPDLAKPAITVAILTSDKHGASREIEAFAARFASETSRARGYQLVEREKLSLVLSETELQQLGVTRPQARTEGFVTAQQLVILSLAEVAGQRQLAARRVEGKTGLVLRQGEVTAPDLRQLYGSVGLLARQVLGESSSLVGETLAFDDSSIPLQFSIWPPVALFTPHTTVSGIALSVLHSAQSKVLGVHAGFSNGNQELHGIEAGLINRSQNATGIQAGLVNTGEISVTGIQAGLYNDATELRGFQFGLINRNRNGLFPVLPFVNFGLAPRGAD